MSSKKEKLEKKILSEIAAIVKDEAKMMKKYKSYKNTIKFICFALLLLTAIFYRTYNLDDIYILPIGVLVGFLFGVSFMYENSIVQWPVLKKYLDIKKLYEDTGELDAFD